MTRRWCGGIRPSSEDSTVVLPEPVPPLTRKASRAAIIARRTSAPASSMVPRSTRSSRLNADRCGMRSEMSVPPTEIGGMTQCRRAPFGSRASTNGAASSRRRPAVAASRWARRRTSDSVPSTTSVSSRPCPRSTHTSQGPLTMTSVVPGTWMSGSSGPAPTRSCRRVRASSRMASSPSTRPSARNAAATRAGVASPSCATSLERTRSRSGALTRREQGSSPWCAAPPGRRARTHRAATAAHRCPHARRATAHGEVAP